MTTPIQPLPSDVVNLIAAGEVIDSLAAGVRELVENSVDAGATRIRIAVTLEQWGLRVSDNGEGICLGDLSQAATAHSTSKIQSSYDLWQIRSLGFRGEALHSLAQLGDLTIASRGVGAEEGWRCTYDHHGQVQRRATVAIAPGTIVTVSHLFGTWPARRNVLPTRTQQLRQIQQTIYHLALCHPHITWQVEQGDRDWFSIYPGETAKAILPQLIRTVQPSDLCEALVKAEDKKQKVEDADVEDIGAEGIDAEGTDADSAGWVDARNPSQTAQNPLTQRPEGQSKIQNLKSKIYLVLGLPDRCHRYRADWIKVAINGRVVRSPELEQTIIGAFRRTLPRDRHPICFVHLTIPPDRIDWNRHPAKLDIYLDQMEDWRRQISEAIGQTLTQQLGTTDSFYSERVSQLIKTAETPANYSSEFSSQEGDPTRSAELMSKPSPSQEGDGRSQNPKSKIQNADAPLLGLKAIAQVHSMYILAEHPGGMWLIEQHIAHERVLYERLCDRWQVVDLESPVILKDLGQKQIDQLHRLELTVDAFGEDLWAVRTLPQALVGREDCVDALLELSQGGNMDEAIVATACRTAIRNGTPLAQPAMQKLLDDWQRTRHPHTCPHGRPIYLVLEESSLSRFFRRHWVIGKSHGI